MSTAKLERPPTEEVIHSAHIFTYESGTSAVDSWCTGDAPSLDCPIYKSKVKDWRTRYHRDRVERDRLESLGFLAPVGLLRHAEHYQGTGKEGAHCPGTPPNGDCPITRALDCAYRAGQDSVTSEIRAHTTNGVSFIGAEGPSVLRDLSEKLKAEAAQANVPRTLTELADSLRDETGHPVSGFHEDADELIDWWVDTTRSDILASIGKVREYGASDLVIMGDVMREWAGHPQGWDRQSGIEMACGFYLLGKIARAVGAYRDGRLPSDDTIYDIYYYAMMIRRIRAVGEWPGVPDESTV